VVLLTDPDYKVTNLYGLRWDAPHETAYPSTFILDKKGMVVFEKISHSHGDRLSAQDALDHLSTKDVGPVFGTLIAPGVYVPLSKDQNAFIASEAFSSRCLRA